MLNKLISSVVLSCSFAVMPATGKEPESLLFLFISPNKWVGTVRLALAIILFVLSFKSLTYLFAAYPKLQNRLLIAGLVMIAFGVVVSVEASLGTFFYDYLKPLDLMIILEAGIITASVALANQPSTKALPVRSKKSRKTTPKLLHKPA
jgi:hypothetical protein